MKTEQSGVSAELYRNTISANAAKTEQSGVSGELYRNTISANAAKTEQSGVSAELYRNTITANTAKTEQSGVSELNRQIFSLGNVAKKLIQLLLCFVMLFGYGMANASSTPFNSNTKPIPALTTLPGLGSGRVDYGSILTYPNNLVSTSLSWTRQVGASGPANNTNATEGHGVSADSDGNAYVVGYTNVGISGQTQQNDREDYFIAKYNSNGSLIWTRQVGAAGSGFFSYTEATGVSVGKDNNIYVTGWTDVGISGQSQNGYYDYFIAKYDVNGSLIWTKQVGVSGRSAYGYGISANESGSIYVTGYTDCGPSCQTMWDYFIAKYDVNGNLIWSKQVGYSNQFMPGSTYGYGISANESGSIYVTGWTDAGISGQKQNGNQDYFIAKYDKNGNLDWTKQVGASGGYTYGKAISADESGNAYVTGYTTVGLSGQKQNGKYDYLVAKYDKNGNLAWARQVGDTGGDTEGSGISANESGNIYVTGQTNRGISGQKQNGYRDYFVAKYDTVGNFNGTTQVGASGGYTYGYGISATESGNVYVTGKTTVGLSGQTQQAGLYDYFIAKYTN